MVLRLLNEGRRPVEIARLLGVNRSTVAYHARRVGSPPIEKFNRRYDWAEIQRYHDAGHSMRACKAKFRFSSCSWHAAIKRGALVSRPAAAPIEVYLVRGRRVSRTHLKGRLVAEGLKKQECEDCGLRSWRGKPLSMALHHVNGDGDDNRLENLQLLCPNCHSQTHNFSGRGMKKRRKRLVLVEDVAA